MSTASKSRKPRSITNARHETIVNNSPRTFTDADFPVGSVSHQGDLILVRLDAMPTGKTRINRQLADGTTQGTRHVLTIGCAFDCDSELVSGIISRLCPGAKISPRYIGPVFETDGGVADLVHPEHGHHHYRGDMTIAVVYQRSLDAEEREQRVRD